jgi:DNA-binding winged helix-turn-helix (wHTH) protein
MPPFMGSAVHHQSGYTHMLYCFHDYTLDEARRELRQRDQLVAIEPKMFQVLLYLLQHHDRVVRKEELLEQCWPEIFPPNAGSLPSSSAIWSARPLLPRNSTQKTSARSW